MWNYARECFTFLLPFVYHSKPSVKLSDRSPFLGEREEVTADDDLQVEVREEECAATNLVAEGLVRIVVADGVREL